jgi:hypothetical protein
VPARELLQRSTPPPRPGGARSDAAWCALAVALLVASALLTYSATWRAGVANHVPSVESGSWEPLVAQDHFFVVWMVQRNARALLRAPSDFFEAEPCFPAKRSVALGEPLLTMGLLALPLQRLTGGPVATWNATLGLMLVLAGCGMFALVARLSGSYPAGIAAGLLYALHPVRLADPVHPYAYDTAWTVWALFFADRLLERGRWRDALGLAASAVLQLGASFYALVAGAAVALPVVGWWSWRRGLSRVPRLRLLVAAALPAALAAWLFAPYLDHRAAGALAARAGQAFADATFYLPGGLLFPGWLVLALALGAGLPRRASGPGAAPRAALLAGGLCAALLATGTVWRVAAQLPGFDAVRRPALVGGGLSLALCALAGLGFARLEHRLPARWARVAALAALLLGAALGGWNASRSLVARPLAADPELLAFYRELAARGDAGPLFEMPVRSRRTAQQVFLSGFHHRPTSACLASYRPDAQRLEALGRALPGAAALRELRSLGFASVVYHHDIGSPPAGGLPRDPLRRRLRALDREASRPDGGLLPLYADAVRSAWSIRPAGSPAEPSEAP